MTKKYAFKKGFTLAEVMIVLTVIGVLTAILLPVARQSMSDENLMKFKKAHNTLGTVIRELVTSDKYYLDGDLGVKPDSTVLSNSNRQNWTYFCATLADVLNTKAVNCSESSDGSGGTTMVGSYGQDSPKFTPTKLEEGNYELKINSFDASCKKSAITTGAEIVTSDDIVIFQGRPASTFGMGTHHEEKGGEWIRSFGGKVYMDENGFDAVYKTVCIDIDGIPSNATQDDCINECPFGYGIRADGKILTGARADEWLERDVNEE